jgi:hypothetical protein
MKACPVRHLQSPVLSGYVIPVLITDLTSLLREEQLKAVSD